jgi:DNA-binding NtrC family response regulator
MVRDDAGAMFHLTRRNHNDKSSLTPSLADTVSVLAITQNPDDAGALRQIAATWGWKLCVAESFGAAMPFLKQQRARVVICDRDLENEDWRDVLARIAALPQAVYVLVASREVDAGLWQQVIHHYGYDVISKPFHSESLRRAVTFAWSWRGWTNRDFGEAPRPPA